MRQIIVPVPNQPGAVADVCQLLADHAINIEEMDAESAVSNGVIVLRVDRYDDAIRALRFAGYRALTEDAIVLQLEDRPGALAEVAQRLKLAAINIRSLRIAHRMGRRAIVTLVTEDQPAARRLLADLELRLPA